MTARVYELAKKYGITNKELLHILAEKGFELPSHMSALSDKAIQAVEEYFNAKKEVAQTVAKSGPKFTPEVPPVTIAQQVPNKS
jgi:ribosomal protein S13